MQGYESTCSSLFFPSLVHLLKPEINPIFADKATVIMETARYVYNKLLSAI